MINGFDNTFLMTSGSTQHYKTALDNTAVDYYWVQAIDIQVEEDAYERTGDPARQTKIINLLNTFIADNHLTGNWFGGGFDDDLGWTALALIRGYMMTNVGNFLTQAEYAVNSGYNGGWDTKNGGIWYHNPTVSGDEKTALANDSLGKAAALIYEATGDTSYLTKANNIYNWVWNNLYNSSTGQVYAQINGDGSKDTTDYRVYDQGTFIDFANALDQINGGGTTYLNDATRTINYTKSYYNSGVINHADSTTGTGANRTPNEYTWADEFARGLGHVVRDNNLWSTYYSWMVTNANAIMSHRRTDLNIMNNNWTTQMPTDSTPEYTAWCDSATAWLQYTPATQPNSIGGIHIVTNKIGTNIRIDNGGVRTPAGGPNKGVLVYPGSGNQNEKWVFRLNSLDGSYCITSMQSFQALDNTGSTANGTQMIQYPFNGNDNQRWLVTAQADGSYVIQSKASGSAEDVLDSGSVTSGTNPLLQWGLDSGAQQHWLLQ